MAYWRFVEKKGKMRGTLGPLRYRAIIWKNSMTPIKVLRGQENKLHLACSSLLPAS